MTGDEAFIRAIVERETVSTEDVAKLRREAVGLDSVWVKPRCHGTKFLGYDTWKLSQE